MYSSSFSLHCYHPMFSSYQDIFAPNIIFSNYGSDSFIYYFSSQTISFENFQNQLSVLFSIVSWRSVLRLRCFRWYNSLYELPVPQYNLSKGTPQNAFLHSMKYSDRLWPIIFICLFYSIFEESLANTFYLSILW